MRDAPAGAFNWTCGRAIAAFVLAVTATAGDADAQGTRIARNRWTTSVAFQAEPVPDSAGKVNRVRLRGPNGYLAVVGTAVETVGWDRVQNAAGIWAIHPDQGYVRFRNDLSGTMLHYEKGYAQVGPIQAAWWSAMFTLTTGTLFATSPTPTQPTTRPLMSNRWKSDVKFEVEPIGANPPLVRLRTTTGVLSISNGTVGITSAPILETTASSSQWFVAPVGSATADCTRPDCFFRLSSITMQGFLNNESGALVVGPIQPEWHSAMWTRGTGAATPSTPVPTLSTPYATTPVQPPPPATRQLMSNRWKSEVRFEIEPISLALVRLRTTAGWLTLSNGRVGITSAPVATTTSSSSDWQVISIAPAPMDCARPDCFFRLSNPAGTGVLNNETGALVVGPIRDDWHSAMWIRGSGTTTPSTFVPAMPAPTPVTPPPPPTGRQLMSNRWKSDVAFEIDPISLTRFRLRTTAGWLTVTNGRIGITPAPVTPTTTSSSEWLLQPIGSATVDCTRPDCFYRLTSPVGSGYLNNETGTLLVGQINTEWHSAMWIRGPGTATPSTFVPAMPATTQTPPPAPKMLANRSRTTSVLLPVAAIDTPYVHLRQVETGRFLVMENRQLELVTAGYGSHLGMWRMEPVPGESFVRLRNRITGDYVHIESGSVGVGQVAAGTFKLEWHSGMWTVLR